MDTGSVLLGIALAAAVVAIVVLLLRSRGRHTVDPEELRTLLRQTLSEQDATIPARSRHAAALTPASGIASSDQAGSLSELAAAPATSMRADGEQSSATAGTVANAVQAVGQAPGGVVSDGVSRITSMAAAELAAAKAEIERARQSSQVEAAAARARIAADQARADKGAAALVEERRAVAADQDRLRGDRADVVRQRADIAEREQALHERMAAADGRQIALDKSRLEVDSAQLQLDAGRAELAQNIEQQRRAQVVELQRISSLTAEQARVELLAAQEDAIRRDTALLCRRIETEAQTTAKQRARRIVADAIQRVASDQTSQSVVSVLQLPSDELKGRIIGREGRNIRAFETVTGVNVIIDDTPEAVLLSCFDPVRREIGRITLQALIDDGRIHPHRIEEAYERAQEEVEALCARAAEDALLEVGITDLHPELAALVGQLKYRSSYGQNVLGHLIETSHIARLMASELGVEPTVVARGAFLHDIGKALTHEAQGSHAIVGAEIARKFGESADVVHCIEAHHDEVPPTTVEAVLTQAADACSGGRPGARRESLESYVQRLEHIEAIASAKKGVDKVFAMQAGRELRVMVKPEVVDDLEAHVMAREVAKQIEEELTYPGQVRVTVIRESRATEVAR